MDHSYAILGALHAAGVNQCSVETDLFTHSIKVRIGQGDNVHTAAQILWECLPAGVQTVGDTAIGVADGVGGIHPIRISRLYETHEVFEDEDYDVRGRVCQPLEEGWQRVQPPTEGLLRNLYCSGVVAWDLHWKDDVFRLFVDQGADGVLVAQVLRDAVIATEGEERHALTDRGRALIRFTRFQFTQPEPENIDYMTVRHASHLLGHTVQEILSLVRMSQYTQVKISWNGSHTLLTSGPRLLTVDTDSLHAFLVSRGFQMDRNYPVGDPVAYIQREEPRPPWLDVTTL